MRIHVVLLLGIFTFAIISLFSSQAREDPADTAVAFINRVQQGDTEGALLLFGDNTCHCAPKGGYISYLNYEGAHDPSLAFMFGRSFTTGKAIVKQLPFNNEKYVFPWDRPEDVAVFIPVEFTAKDTSTYFIPMDSAFGHTVSLRDLKSFEANPAFEWMRAFTLRLRPNLEPGFIKPPDPRAKPIAGEAVIVEKDLPPEVLRYMHPGDAGAIELPDGATVPLSKLTAELPRLKSIIVGMKIVRRGQLKRWTIQKIGVQDAIIVSNGQEFKLSEQDSQSALKLAPDR